jgi:hypothetical protein
MKERQRGGEPADAAADDGDGMPGVGSAPHAMLFTR